MVVVRWAVLTAASAVLVVRWAGLRGGWVTNAVLAGTPLLALLAVAVLLEAAARRHQRVAVAAVALLVATLATIAPRTIAEPQPRADGDDLTVAVANLKRGRADPATVVRLVRERDVDVLVTIELTERAARALRDAGLDGALPHTVLTPTVGRAGGGVHSRHPLQATSDPAPDGGEPDVLVELDSGTTVHLTATHPRPPINAAYARSWFAVLDQLPSADETPQADVALLLGDLNATLDHRVLWDLLDRGWRDAADEVGAGLTPTYWGVWTGRLTPPLTIDHVLVDARVAVRDVSTHRLPGSDHSMLVAELQLP